ncbi:1440_t:CDS:2 [Ambispora leptoticha]|uniref:1440_t:CDS:1 n=1 Tax=Ambispora leptoticha TaxID=144679 RepID=A0A9N9EI39_9GLOM|nr:1440_t:CDS:2 [Ambispora leptoticha]
MASKIRKHVTTACQNCRNRKARCSGKPRCQRCMKNNLDCVFINPTKKRGPPKNAHNEIIESRLSRISRIDREYSQSLPKSNPDYPTVRNGFKPGLPLLKSPQCSHMISRGILDFNRVSPMNSSSMPFELKDNTSSTDPFLPSINFRDNSLPKIVNNIEEVRPSLPNISPFPDSYNPATQFSLPNSFVTPRSLQYQNCCNERQGI